MQTIRQQFLFSYLMIAACLSMDAEDPKAAIQTKLEAQYALTQPTADNTEIVTAGAVLVFALKGNNLIMAPVSSTNFYQNTYKDGKISQNALGKSLRALDRFNHLPGVTPSNASNTRTFVPGEKMWVTKIEVKDDGVTFDLFTDAYSEVRYKAALRFPFVKGSIPAPDEMAKTVATVFKVQPAEDTNTSAQQQAPARGQRQQSAVNSSGAAMPAGNASSQAGAAEPAAVIPPPPPPPADTTAVVPPPPPPPADAPQAAPKTVSLGQTPEQVTSVFGQPKKVVKLGAKQIYYYDDFKVTFVGGKATDIQ